MFLLLEGMYMRYVGIFLICGAIIVMPFVSYAIAKLASRGLRGSIDIPGYAVEDERIPIRISISGWSSLLGPITINEGLPEWFERISDDPFMVAGNGDHTIQARAHKRGEYILGPLAMGISDPLGFFRSSIRQGDTYKVVILPSPLRVPELEISQPASHADFAADAASGRGTKGSGLDFHGVREYQPGDDLRRVHWPSTARHGRLDVIEFEHVALPETVVAIETKRGTEVGSGRFSSLEYSVKLAAAIAEHSMAAGGTVALAGVENSEQADRQSTGPDHLYAILEALARVQADGDCSLSEVLLAQLDRVRSSSEIICLVPRLDDAVVRAAALLGSRGVRVRVVVIAVGSTVPGSEHSSELVAAGASLVVLECSNKSMQCRVSYSHAI